MRTAVLLQGYGAGYALGVTVGLTGDQALILIASGAMAAWFIVGYFAEEESRTKTLDERSADG